MSTRIFISYRTADGMDKATALSRDLGRIFGAGAVFLDKDDLRGGTDWREEIGRTLQSQPILLLLMTPLLIEARQDDGSLRIGDPADPVRRELEAAIEAGAHIIPVMCDGLNAPPDATKLPAPFHRIGSLTWRKLRAYDWNHDVERLAADLRALGVMAAAPVAPDAAAAQAAVTASPSPRGTSAAPPATGPAAPARRPWLAAAAAALLAAAAVGGWWAWHGKSAADASSGLPSAAALSGRWGATLWQGERTMLVFTPTPQGLALASEPIAIDGRADWADYRKAWRERTGRDLAAVMYRGEGTVRADPGQPAAIDIAIKVHPVPDNGEPLDSGNLSGTLSADGRRLDGKIWLNGAQADQPASLVREGTKGATVGPAKSPTAVAPAAPAAPVTTAATTAATAPPGGNAAPLPQVRLAGPAELTFNKIRKSTYTVLAVTSERGDSGHWRLRAKIRLTTAPNSGGINFWDSSFRLLIDGVPRAPDSKLNEIVDSGASKDGDLTWDVPFGAQALVLRVHHYSEAGDLPLAWSGGGPAQMPAAAALGPVALSLDAPAEVQFAKPAPVTFTVLSVASRPRRSGVYGVHARVRMALPAGAVAANFWNDQFRLLVDGVPRAPDSDLNAVVEGASALDGELSFEVPASAKSLALRIQWAENAAADLPLKLEKRP